MRSEKGPLDDVSGAFALSIFNAHPAPFPVLSLDSSLACQATPQTLDQRVAELNHQGLGALRIQRQLENCCASPRSRTKITLSGG